jgi:hypothetical protein
MIVSKPVIRAVGVGSCLRNAGILPLRAASLAVLEVVAASAEIPKGLPAVILLLRKGLVWKRRRAIVGKRCLVAGRVACASVDGDDVGNLWGAVTAVAARGVAGRWGGLARLVELGSHSVIFLYTWRY